MALQAVTGQASGNAATIGGIAASLSRLSQPDFLANDTFAAYLLSLSDPAAQVLASLTRSQSAPAVPAAVSPAGSAASAVLAGLSGSVPPATALIATAATSGPSPAVLDGAAALAASVAASSPAEPPQAGADALTDATAPTSADTANADLAAAADARTADANAANDSQTARLADDVLTAANAATVAGNAAINAFYAASAAGAVTQGSDSQATDATAKFMASGTMGLPDRSLSAYLAVQDAIPAVNGVVSAAAMAAYTSGNSQNDAYAQAQPTPQVPAMNPGAGSFDFVA
jgi:hypothetical protein